MTIYLAYKEIWRNKSRFLLISAVVALITTLVLFIAGLAEGLGLGQREFIEKLNADLLVYRSDVDLEIPASRLGLSKLNDVLRIEGVRNVGPLGFSSVTIEFADGREPFDITLIGAEPGKPGEPGVEEGQQLVSRRSNEAIIDRITVLETGLQVGDRFTIKSLQGTEAEFYTLRVVGITDSRRYLIRPAVVVPFLEWNDIKPQAEVAARNEELTADVFAVKLQNPAELALVRQRMTAEVDDIEVATLTEAYLATPGYQPQQSTLTTQKNFALLISLLVIGGFFQIQTLQKVAQVGMLKAIGASSWLIVVTALIQILMVTAMGVVMGAVGTLLLAANFPVSIPIIFTPESVVTTVVTLLIIGPVSGLVAIRSLLKIEPLTALGLGG